VREDVDTQITSFEHTGLDSGADAFETSLQVNLVHNVLHSSFRVSEGNRTRCLDVHSVACHPATPQTPSVSSPGWIRTSDLPHVTGMSCPLNDGTNAPRPGFEPGTPS